MSSCPRSGCPKGGAAPATSHDSKARDPKARDFDELADGDADGLTPLTTLDPDAIGDFDDLLTAMSRTSFGGRSLGEALDVLQAMIEDKDCLVVMSLSGAMTVAKMGKVICKMIDEGWVNAVVSTGALMAHGFIESIGLKHYKYEFGRMDDAALYDKGYNRVYDTLEPEKNFVQADEVMREVLRGLTGEQYLWSEKLCRAIGRHLSENYPGKGILKSAFEADVPVYIPAFTDSELALDVASHILCGDTGFLTAEGEFPERLPFQFNPFMDLFSYAKLTLTKPKLGIFTIGGGVPRNWAQQVGPFVEIACQRVEALDLPQRRFHYGVRICPEPVHWGGLSGCTYQEGVSWGKFVHPDEGGPGQGGKFAEVHADATIAWPILIKALDQRLKKSRG